MVSANSFDSNDVSAGDIVDNFVQEGIDVDDDHRSSDRNSNEDDKPAASKPTATSLATVLNLCNNLVGAGLLTLPYCLKNASIMVGIVLLFVVGALSAASFTLLAALCDATGQFTFRGLCEVTLGKKSAVVIQSVIAVYTTVSCLSYLILCADFVAGDKGIANWVCGLGSTNADDDSTTCGNWVAEPLTQRGNVLVAVSVCILLPLCLLRSLSALQFTSSISFAGMAYVATLMVVHFFSNRSIDVAASLSILDTTNSVTTTITTTLVSAMWEPLVAASNATAMVMEQLGQCAGSGGPEEANWFHLDGGVFTAAPIMNVAFIAQYNAPRYYEELKDRSVWKYFNCVVVAFSICFSVYVVTAVFGYLSFGQATKSNVLLNFERDDLAAQVARVAMTCVVLFTYPLAFHPLRSSVLSLHSQYNQRVPHDGLWIYLLEDANESEDDTGLMDVGISSSAAKTSPKCSPFICAPFNAIKRRTDAFILCTVVLMVATIVSSSWIMFSSIYLPFNLSVCQKPTTTHFRFSMYVSNRPIYRHLQCF
jgi:amino acid permease